MGNASSMLTQYDIEEVQEHCNHTFSQQEILSLYQRFCQVDRKGCGFISGEEFLSVPEFAVNPLSQRLFRMIDGLNFKEFVAFLSAFSVHASLQQKVEYGKGKVTFDDMLEILQDLTGQFMSDVQRKGVLVLVGGTTYEPNGLVDVHIPDGLVQEVLTRVLEEAGYSRDSSLVQSDFLKILGSSGLKMEVEIPVD